MSSQVPGGGNLSADEMQAAIASLSTPDLVESPFGRLEFFDGLPTASTTAAVYDALDLMRGIEVFLNCVPGASLVAMRRGLRAAGVTSASIIGITEPRANSNSLFLTPNTETTYGTTFLDLKSWGPTVIEAPPQSLCVVDDFWFRYVTDMGIPGPDHGAGGSYLFLPPRIPWRGPRRVLHLRVPDVLQLGRAAGLGGVSAMKQTRIYPLSQAAAPEVNTFINLAEATMNTVHANDFSFYEELHELIQEEPTSALDAERAGQLAAIGLAHSQPFVPDERMRAILGRAATIGAAMSRVVAYTPRDPGADLYGSWKNAFVGGSHEFLRDGARLSTPAPSSTTWPPSSPPPWPMPRSAPDRPTPTQSTTARASCSTVAGTTDCMSTPTHRPRTSGPSTCTTPRPGPCSRCRPRSARCGQQHRHPAGK